MAMDLRTYKDFEPQNNYDHQHLADYLNCLNLLTSYVNHHTDYHESHNVFGLDMIVAMIHSFLFLLTLVYRSNRQNLLLARRVLHR